jgi:hypothetical protein
VEADGEQFTVFQTRINAGYEYEFRGRWLPESDPRIQAMRNRETLKDSPAYSCVAGGVGKSLAAPAVLSGKV